MPPPLLYGASLWNRIQRTVGAVAAFELIVGLGDEELRRSARSGTTAGCGFRPIAATIAGATVIRLLDDRSRRVCSQPA